MNKVVTNGCGFFLPSTHLACLHVIVVMDSLYAQPFVFSPVVREVGAAGV